MSSTAARQGIPSRQRQEQAAKSERLRLDAAQLLENPAWAGAVGELRTAYTDALLDCPERDDKMRYQLQIALKVIKKVEGHVVAAHSSANFDAKKAIKADFGKKSYNPFRR